MSNGHIVCRNPDAERIIPRMARLLRDAYGWSVDAAPRYDADFNYFLGYFELDHYLAFTATPWAAYLTHIETNAPDKAALWWYAAEHASLRVVMNAAQLAQVGQYGLTVQPPLPVETERFTITDRPAHTTPLVGVSGYTYATGRKGEQLLCDVLKLPGAANVTWTASGRGWPVPTLAYRWGEMPTFYQNLDVYVCPSLLEGGPLGTLEALACGVPVVIPDSVGLHPELPTLPGIYRYPTGDAAGLADALALALAERHNIDRAALREVVTARHGVAAWVAAHATMWETPRPAQAWHGRGGFYVVAFGEPARDCARRLLASLA